MQPDHVPGISMWSSAVWRESVTAWVDTHLATSGLQRTGAPEQVHLRPWGSVYRIPTSRDPVWFKAPAPATVFEVGLYGLLVRHAPDLVLAPLAVDHERGWLLLPDGGTTLGEIASGPGLVDRLVTILPRYAQLQRDLALEVEAMLALGLTDMRATAMPARFDEAFAAIDTWVSGHGNTADRDLLTRIAAHRKIYVARCDSLAAAPGAPSIDHNDLHPKNVFVTSPGPPLQVAFADWGDAVVAHPFATLLVTLNVVAHHLNVTTEDPAVLRVRDAYLEAFTDLASHDDLVATVDLACHVAKVTRALVWLRSLEAANDPAHPFAREPLDWFATILNDAPLDTSDP